VAHVLDRVDAVMVGAEGVVETGGAVSRIGTYQIGLLAKALAKPLYVLAETHKFVRLFPLDQHDLPVRQPVLDFRTDDDGSPPQSFDSAVDYTVSGRPDHNGDEDANSTKNSLQGSYPSS
jgi:translation initiation factor eIF-2B subunit alpha